MMIIYIINNNMILFLKFKKLYNMCLNRNIEKKDYEAMCRDVD